MGVDGRCGCTCQNFSHSCSCPYRAHLESRVVTCNDGLYAAGSGTACIASWQKVILASSGVLITVAACLLFYFVYGVLRTAGLTPCHSNKKDFGNLLGRQV